MMTQEEMELIHERLEKIRKLGQREAGFLRLARNQLVEEDRATQSWRRQLEEKREQSLSRSRSRSRSRPPSSPGKLCYSKALDKVFFSFLLFSLFNISSNLVIHVIRSLIVCC